MLILQGRIQGYMYNIKSEQDYQERIIPPSPERPSSPPVRSSLLSRWGPTPLSLIDSLATSTSTAAQGTLATLNHPHMCQVWWRHQQIGSILTTGLHCGYSYVCD